MLWLLICMIAVSTVFSRSGTASLNNYYVYKGVFHHLVAKQDLYALYPEEHTDVNHYGPVFAILIAPFAILPDLVGCFAWCLANALVFLFSIKMLRLPPRDELIILLISLLECVGSLQNQQFNPMLTGFLIMAFVLVQQEREILAAFLVMICFYVKIYGVVGFSFILFAGRPKRYAGALIFWGLALFCIPALVTGWQYLINTYKGWFMSIREKNLRNADLSNISQQDISLMGLVRRLSGVHISNITFLVPAAIMSLIPLLYKKNYTNKRFRFLFLAHVLMTMVLFSTSSESPTYIIAVTGAAIWFRALPGQRNAFEKGMVVFMLLLTSVAYTDVVPRTFRNEYIVRYSLKALPLSLIWMYNILHLIKYSINSNSIYAQEGRHRCAGI